MNEMYLQALKSICMCVCVCIYIYIICLTPDVNLFIYIYIIYKVESKCLLYSENRHMNEMYLKAFFKKKLSLSLYIYICALHLIWSWTNLLYIILHFFIIYIYYLLFKTFTYYLKKKLFFKFTL